VVAILRAGGAVSHGGVRRSHQAFRIDFGRAIGQDFAIQLEPAGFSLGSLFPMQNSVLHHGWKLEGISLGARSIFAGQHGIPGSVEMSIGLRGAHARGGGQGDGER
jgi:hypothetical protein